MSSVRGSTSASTALPFTCMETCDLGICASRKSAASTLFCACERAREHHTCHFGAVMRRPARIVGRRSDGFRSSDGFLHRCRVERWAGQNFRGLHRSRIIADFALEFPKAAIVAALFFPPPARTGTWIIALIWMGTACILNSRRCGRTHCRYTGPYYLAMIAPVLVLASGVIFVDFYAWLSLAVLILGGSMIIWWATERAWGKFLRHDSF